MTIFGAIFLYDLVPQFESCNQIMNLYKYFSSNKTWNKSISVGEFALASVYRTWTPRSMSIQLWFALNFCSRSSKRCGSMNRSMLCTWFWLITIDFWLASSRRRSYLHSSQLINFFSSKKHFKNSFSYTLMFFKWNCLRMTYECVSGCFHALSII